MTQHGLGFKFKFNREFDDRVTRMTCWLLNQTWKFKSDRLGVRAWVAPLSPGRADWWATAPKQWSLPLAVSQCQ